MAKKIERQIAQHKGTPEEREANKLPSIGAIVKKVGTVAALAAAAAAGPAAAVAAAAAAAWVATLPPKWKTLETGSYEYIQGCPVTLGRQDIPWTMIAPVLSTTQKGERDGSWGDPLKALLPSFARVGWDANESTPIYYPLTPEQSQQARQEFALWLARLEGREAVTLWTESKVVDGQEKIVPKTVSGKDIASWISANILPRMTFALAPNVGQRRSSILPASLYAYNVYPYGGAPRDYNKFTVPGVVKVYGSELDAMSDRIKENLQAGRAPYSNEDWVGIALKFLALGVSKSDIAFRHGWTVGQRQAYCDRAELCRAYAGLNLLGRMLMPKPEKGKSAYTEGGHVPFSILTPQECRLLLGTATRPKTENDSIAIKVMGGFVEGRQATSAQVEEFIRTRLTDGRPKDAIGKEGIKTLARLLTPEVGAAYTLLQAIVDGDLTAANKAAENIRLAAGLGVETGVTSKEGSADPAESHATEEG